MEVNLNSLALILGVLGGISAAIVYFRGAWDKGTIASLKESRDAYKDLAEQRELHITEIEHTNSQLTSENRMLTALATKSADVETLKSSLEAYQIAIEAQGEKISESLTEILLTLRRNGSNGSR